MPHAPSLVSVPLSRAYRLVGHGPVLLVSTQGLEHPNVAPIAWYAPYDTDPARFILVIAGGHATFKNIVRTGELVLNIPGPELASAVLAAGSASATDSPDKFTLAGLETEPSEKVLVPRVRGCIAWMECRLVDPELARSHELIMAELLCASCLESAWRESSPDVERHPTLHHLGGQRFGLLSRVLEPPEPSPSKD